MFLKLDLIYSNNVHTLVTAWSPMSLSAWVYEMRVGVYLKLASFTIISNLCWLLRTASLDVHEPRSNAQML